MTTRLAGGAPAPAPAVGKQEVQKMENLVWYGGRFSNQDVTVVLVPAGNVGSENALAVLKLHSSQLCKCSKYFQARLSERWLAKVTKASIETILEVHADVDCYKDCFSRMYSPSPESFKSVQYCLDLFKVASQIEYQEVMDTTLRFLSSVSWSLQDELMIRRFSSSADYPSDRGAELSARLGLHMTKEKCHQQVCDLIRAYVGAAMRHDKLALERLRSFLSVILKGIGFTTCSELAKNVVTIVSTAVKNMILDFDKECDGRTDYRPADRSRLVHMLTVVSWTLELFLEAKVAGELVQHLAQDEKFPNIIARIMSATGIQAGGNLHGSRHGLPIFGPRDFSHALTWGTDAGGQAGEVLKKFPLIYKQVLSGHVLLSNLERVALFKNWQSVFKNRLLGEDYERALRAGKDLFMTLPLEQQVELLSTQLGKYTEIVDAGTLAMLVQRCWNAKESEPAASICSPTHT